MSDTAITIISSLLSGLLGVGISTLYYRRFEIRKFRVDTVKKFIANRYDLNGDEFSRALNEIFLVFNESPKVMAALEKFHSNIITGQPAENSLLYLFKALCIEIEIDPGKLNDSFFLRPFGTRSPASAP